MNARTAYNAKFSGRWIGLGGPLSWVPHSTHFSSLDSFMWRHLKSIIYENPIDSDETLVTRIAAAAVDVREIPGVFKKVRCLLHRRFNA